MTAYTLFGQSGGAALTSDPSPYTLGVQFSVSQPACTLTAIWWNSPAGAGNLPGTIALYTVTGAALIHSETPSWSGAAGSGWVRAALATPQLLTAATNYVGAVFDTAVAGSWYGGTGSYWNSGPGNAGAANGPLQAPSSTAAVNGQDIFNSGATLTFPATTFNAANYWVDVEVSFTYPYSAVRPAKAALPAAGPARGHGRGSRGTPAAASVSIAGVTGTVTVAALPGTVTAVTGTPGRAARPRAYRISRGHAAGTSQGTRSTTVTGVTGTVTVTAIAGTITAVTGSPGRAVRRQIPVPRRGHGSGTFAAPSLPGTVSGVPGVITVTGTGGQVMAYTGLPGKVIRPAAHIIPRGTGHGSRPQAVAVPAVIAGPAGSVTVAALPGTVTAVTGSPARVTRRAAAPARGTGRGIFAATAVHGITSGTPGLITLSAPAGTVQAAVSAAVHGPAGIITLAAVTGTVTAVTGSPGRVICSRVILPPARHPGRGQHGTAGTAVTAATGKIAVIAPAGTVQAFTGSPGRAVRSRMRMPPRPAPARGTRGTAGTQIAGAAGLISTTGIAGGISAGIAGTAGTVAVAAPPGFIVLVPYRYIRWHIPEGFACTGPRSHVITGNAGRITVTAPAGTAAGIQDMTAGAEGRAVISRTRMPPQRGKAK